MSTESSGCSTDSHLASACLPSFVPRQGVVSYFCRDALGLEPGDSLSVVRHMLARRELLIDLNQPINPRKRLVLLKAPSVDFINQEDKVG